MRTITRRTFVSQTAKATAALALGSAPFVSSGRTSVPSANERIGVGIIGCGWWGHDRLMSYLIENRDRLNVEVVAVCDVWSIHLDRAVNRLREANGRRPASFTRYQDLLADPAVDAVMIATPDFSHAQILVDAARAGKHVWVEKPLSNRLEHANAALEAVEASGIVCQVGTHLRSNPRFRGGAKLVQSGILGQLVQIEAVWPSAAPRWLKEYDDVRREDVDWEAFLMDLPKEEFHPRRFRLWQLYKDFTNGMIGILGSHLLDIAHWFSEDSLPERCVGMGNLQVWTDRESDDAQECIFRYSRGHLLRFGGRLGNDRPGMNVAFYGTRGYFDTASWTASGEGGGEDRIQDPVPVEPVETSHHQEDWLDCIRRNDPGTRADIFAGHAHAVASILGFQAIEQRRELRYDPAAKSIS